ncbi:MAG TPA: hypothetical protein VNY73_02855 [Bacteroidia bacterium]|jgi:hypothetical protein|nr:hypothetical protein [Bacteroidia bacterium]
MQPIRTTTAEYSILEKQIILCRMLENAHVDLPEVKENFEATMKLADGKPYAALLDARVTATVTKEAMEEVAKPEYCRLLVANAIVINSLANRLIGNFIIKFYKPPSPTKLFSDHEAARTWLRGKLERKMGGERLIEKNMYP